MYKTKLQELCHKKQWGLPQYSILKDGPEHGPRFKASVSVNGQSFHSPFPSKSSRAAQNDAAKLAFLRFFTPANDLQGQYKSQLQDYSQWKNLDLPLYSSKSEGPSHAIRFKATVTVSGHAFESPEFFKTLKEAEHAAAKAALKSLSFEGFQKDDSGLYKNLLRELSQREGFSIPIYNTIKTGESHMPTFFSTVEVEGERFCGKAGKSKKQAELNAAEVAYSFLKDRGLSRSAEVASTNLVEDDPPLTTSSILTMTMESQQKLEHECKYFPSPTIEYEEPSKESAVYEVQEVGLTKSLLASTKADTEDSISYPAEPQMGKNIKNGNSISCFGSVPLLASVKAETEDSISCPAEPQMDKNIKNGNSISCFESVPLLASAKAETEDSISYPVESQMDKNIKNGNSISCFESIPLLASSKEETDDCISYPAEPQMDKNIKNGNSISCFESVPFLPKQGPSSSSTLAHPKLTALSISDSNIGKSIGTRSYLLCNRVRVYSSFPDVALPNGITVLPISDNKWVAVSLEFPNEGN